MVRKKMLMLSLIISGFLGASGFCGDWPQWRGANRDGVWSEDGVIGKFEGGRLPVRWRAEVSGGYSGPTVASGLVYVTDRLTSPAAIERVLCFDAATGAEVWSHSYECEYKKVGYNVGPRASVTIDENRGYSLGTMGHLFCFDAAKGDVIWSKDLNSDYEIRMPHWGIAASPVIERDLVIVQIGGRDNACLVAFDKVTGKERWRALGDRVSYSAPIVIDQAGKRVLVCWTGDNLAGLDAMTGELYWKHAFTPSRMVIGIATPVLKDDYIFVSSFYDGSLLVKIDPEKLSAEKVWRRKGPSEKVTDSLHCCISTPVLLGKHIYGVDSFGEFRCLDLLTGDRVWEDLTAVPKARWSNIHMVRNRGKIWMFNERGELIICTLSPQGLNIISRAKLIDPTEGQLKQRGGVCWSHPAYAYKRIYIRNDKELICADLSANDSGLGDVWVLKFEDDFEREDLGEKWISNDAVIREGRLLLGLNGPACAKVVRGFPGDVRIEFTAEAYEKRPPCDLSVTIASERFRTMSWNYLLAFGGVNNTINKLTGGRRLKGMRDENPERLIEPGRVYNIAAAKEGKRLWLTVDGKILLEGRDEEIMGGPGFDAVGLVTWNGMYVDDVRVYERKVPHPDTPEYAVGLEGLILSIDDSGCLSGPAEKSERADKAVDAYNRGDLAVAEKIFKSLDGEIRAAGLAYVYGHLNHDEGSEDFPLVARLFNELSKAMPDDRRIADYAWAASLFGRVRLFPRSDKACGGLMSLGAKNNPFYDKAMLYRARFLRANGQEQGKPEVLATAQAMFRELKTKAPGNVVLRELTGESIAWGSDLIEWHPGAPRWAELLNEMYVRQLAIMNWWFTKRQLPDGQLGGGWGDDVEILRSWGPFAMISDADPTVRDGIEKLCRGVWDDVLVDGFSTGLGDVEHSAEPSADSIPTMLAIRYGDPLWHERNLASCRRIRDYYTGIDNNGFVRFKSGHFGGDDVSEHVQHGGDNHYCPRAMKHFLWPAWYGNNEAKEFYLNWVRGWVRATMTKRYSKVAGVPPATIWYPSGDIAPPNGAAWNDPTYNIYGCCQIGSYRIHDTFLAGYYLSGEACFLQPLHAWMRFYKSEMPQGSAENPDIDKDPAGWAIRNSKDTWKAERPLMQYRWMTGDDSYDELFGRERVQERLHMPGAFDDFIERLEGAVGRLRVNFNLYTREILQTDRAGLPGSEIAFSAFTGAVRPWRDAGVPTMAVTWEVPHRDFAAIVPYTSEDCLRVWTYNFAEETTRVGMRLWRLRPGEYEVRSGQIGTGKGYARECIWGGSRSFVVRHKGDVCWIEVPSRREFAVDVRLVKPFSGSAVLPDPAVAQRDIAVAKDAGGKIALTVTVHNLGNAAVEDLTIALARGDRDKYSVIARQRIDLPGCEDLRPCRMDVKFSGVNSAAGLMVLLDPQEKVSEIYELNNRVNVPDSGQ